MGGEVPKSYYRTTNKLVPKEYMKSITIARRATKKMEFLVPQENSFLKYFKNKLNQESVYKIKNHFSQMGILL